MEEVKTDIYKSLKRNQTITRLVVIMASIISIVAILSVFNLYKNNSKFIYRISGKNNLMPLERIEKAELNEVFRKGHIELFFNRFYSYDQWSYKSQIDKSLWLIDDSGKNLYYYYRDQGHFNQLIQSTSSQSINNVQIQLDSKGNFIANAIVEVNKIGQIEKNSYKLSTRGKLIKVKQNYPKNPYGYLITNFKEISKTKVVE